MPSTPSVSRLSDHQLLASAKELAHRERHLNLRIIEHLREIGSRGLHLRHGYGSLFDYAIIRDICKYYNGLRVTPISRYCFRNPLMVSDHP